MTRSTEPEEDDMLSTLTAERATTTTSTRVDLMHRSSGGVDVTLYWQPEVDALTLRVVDHNAERAIELDVARDRATYAFHHPFPYALEQGAGLP
jgi:hypothetical protein